METKRASNRSSEDEEMKTNRLRICEAMEKGLIFDKRPRVPQERRASTALLRCDGFDVLKKSNLRKQRYLMMLPGQLAPSGTGIMGELSCLDTQNPVLYLRFPKGRMKLLGALLYPKCRYLSLRVGNKKISIEDVFESIIVFTKAFWIGSIEENPKELPMPMPHSLQERVHEGYTYHGGASRPTEDRQLSQAKTSSGGSVKDEGAFEVLREDSEGTEGSLPEISPKRSLERSPAAPRPTRNKRRRVLIEEGSAEELQSEESESICVEEEEDPDYEL